MNTSDLQALLVAPAFGDDGNPTGATDALLDATKEYEWVEAYLSDLVGRSDVLLAVQDRARQVLCTVSWERHLPLWEAAREARKAAAGRVTR